tara:strand:+ start:519 stop:2102 length:1584 start_codon:yes stop_codon:yes gene_type:complete
MANQILIQGAAQVAQAKQAGKLAVAQGATKVAKHLSDNLSEVFQTRNKEFNDIMNTTLEQSPGLSNEAYGDLYDQFQRMRGEYVYLNQKDRAMMLRRINEQATGIEENENLKTDIASDLGDTDIVGDDIVEDLGENADNIKDIVNGNKKPIIVDGKSGHLMEDPNGEQFKGLTFSEAFARNRKIQQELHGNDYSKWTNFMWAGSRSDSPDGKLTEYHPFTTDDQEAGAPKTGNKWDGKMWMPNNQIKSLVDKNKIDTNSKDGINGMLETVINSASNLKPGDDTNFPAEKYKNLIENNIINKGNLNSLAKHKIFAGRSFKKDLKEALQTATYEQMGIPKEIIEKLDPTDNGKITNRDARRITKAILDDEDMLKEYLTGYYTKALEQNFNSHVSDEIVNAKKEVIEKQDEENVNVDNENIITDNDRSYDYKVVNGQWYTRKKGDTGRFTNISTKEKYKSSVDQLNKKYPDAGGDQSIFVVNGGDVEESEDGNLVFNPTTVKEIEPGVVDTGLAGTLVNNRPTTFMGSMK